MQESEAKKILMALDGLAAYLETIRNLVISSIEAEPAAPSKGAAILKLMPDDECLHEDSISVETLGGKSSLCNSCGEQF